MRLRLFALVVLFTSLGYLIIAPQLFALPSGLNGDNNCAGCHFTSADARSTDICDTMFAIPIEPTQTPVLDGRIDAVWSSAETVTVSIDHGRAGRKDIRLKALYTTDRIFFLAQWSDNSLSDRIRLQQNDAGAKHAFQNQSLHSIDGISARAGNGWILESAAPSYAGAPTTTDTVFEDKFAIIWGARDTTATVANIQGFKSFGCAALCHVAPEKAGTGSNTMRTDSPPEIADLWQWRFDPSEPIATTTADGFDQYAIAFVGRQAPETETSSSAIEGRTTADIPAKSLAREVSEVAAHKETTESISYDPSTKVWTLEFSRALMTDNEHDVQFDNLMDTYYFGVSVFNNSPSGTQTTHSFNKGAYALEFMPDTEAKFSDTNGHWAQGGITEFVRNGIIIGYPDSMFKPDKAITRAEFLKVVMEAVRIPQTTSTSSFKDIPGDSWFVGYVEGAVEAGLIRGYGDRAFNPNAPITREEAIRILLVALGLDSPALTRSTHEQRDELARFKDTANISAWSYPLMAEAARLSIVEGYGNATLLPQRHISRAEAIAVIQRGMLSRDN